MCNRTVDGPIDFHSIEKKILCYMFGNPFYSKNSLLPSFIPEMYLCFTRSAHSTDDMPITTDDNNSNILVHANLGHNFFIFLSGIVPDASLANNPIFLFE